MWLEARLYVQIVLKIRFLRNGLVLPNHTPIATSVDIDILRIILTANDWWLRMIVMGGFARIGNNEVTILVNDVEKASDIDPKKLNKLLK